MKVKEYVMLYRQFPMIVRGVFSREAVECSSRARSCYLDVEAGWETYIVWLVNVMNHDTNLAA